jgi:4-diphosphocytidyl-2-C-methyl-D-erythritol kinase
VTCQPDLGIPAEDNLAVRAVREFASSFGVSSDVGVHVAKSIPTGGGLGGASSDAAAVLVGMCAIHGIPVEASAVHDVASALGADVPFFLRGGAGLYKGRGDVLERELPAIEAPVVVVGPRIPVSTPAAYAAFDRLLLPGSPAADSMVDALLAGDPGRVARALANNLTEAAAGLVPEVGDVLRFVQRSQGVLGAAMAGSGSSVFGITVDADSAERACAEARERGWWAAATKTSACGVSIRA